MIDTLDINEEIRKVLSNKIESILKNIDIGTIILERIDEYVNERATSGKLKKGMIAHQRIDWNGFELSADRIGNGTIKNFTSSGIDDHATDVNLTIMDGQVVIENELVSNYLTVVEKANIKDLSIDNITINKRITINDSSFAESIKGLIDNRISQKMNNNDIDLNGNPLKSNDQVLLDHKSLGNSIIESNLRKVGRLSSLAVTGETELAETVFITDGKLGINTDEPAGALTAWDEECEVTIRKYKNRTMYFGSTRDSELAFGVAGDGVLLVRRSTVEVPKIKIGNISISASAVEPKERAAPGDFVINDSPGLGKPWAWRCAGGDKWIALQ